MNNNNESWWQNPIFCWGVIGVFTAQKKAIDQQQDLGLSLLGMCAFANEAKSSSARNGQVKQPLQNFDV
jgi:hypothetical protein